MKKHPMQKPSIRQQKVINALISKGVSLSAAFREGGYKPASIRNASQMLKGHIFRQALEPYIGKLAGLRDKMIDEMDAKDLSKEKFKTLSESLSRTNHDLQLLTGGKTENVGITGLADELGALIKDLRNDRPTA